MTLLRTSPTLYLPESVRAPQVLRVVLDDCNAVFAQEKALTVRDVQFVKTIPKMNIMRQTVDQEIFIGTL